MMDWEDVRDFLLEGFLILIAGVMGIVLYGGLIIGFVKLVKWAWGG